MAIDNAAVPPNEARLRQLVDVFLAENKKLNLSAFRTEEHCWIGNVLDSTAVLDAFESVPELRETRWIVDIGTGGGFPLLPLAMTLPDVQCIGIDSVKKKVDAVGRIVETLKLKNVELLAGRLEEFAHEDRHRARYDLVTARALAPLNVLLEYAVPFLREGGLCAFWKSTTYADELAESAEAQKILHTRFLRAYDYELPGGFGKRAILFFRKTEATPEEFPRAVGVPKNKPL